MRLVIGLLGAIQMIGGVLVYLAAKSAIHEILAAVSLGTGTICLALAVVIAILEGIRAELGRR